VTIRLWDLAGAEDERRFSPYCWRVKMALRHKGLEAEEIPWRFTEKDAIAFSGQKLVPVIVDGEREVHDSWAIATHLDEAYPDRPLLVSGDEARTLSYFFKHWVERSVHPALMKVLVLDLFNHVHEKDRP
jgi:glutathione S-transferase